MVLVRHIFHPGGKLGEEVAQLTKPKKKHGVLDRMQDQQEKQQKVSGASIPAATLEKGIARGLKVVSNRFTQKSHFQIYLFDAMERLAALLDSETIRPGLVPGRVKYYQTSPRFGRASANRLCESPVHHKPAIHIDRLPRHLLGPR